MSAEDGCPPSLPTSHVRCLYCRLLALCRHLDFVRQHRSEFSTDLQGVIPCGFISELILNSRNKKLRDNRKMIIGNHDIFNYNEPFKAHWLLHVPPGLLFSNSAFYPQFSCITFTIYRIISLNSIDLSVFVMVTQYAFCEVETKFLDVIYLNFMIQTVNNNL